MVVLGSNPIWLLIFLIVKAKILTMASNALHDLTCPSVPSITCSPRPTPPLCSSFSSPFAASVLPSLFSFSELLFLQMLIWLCPVRLLGFCSDVTQWELSPSSTLLPLPGSTPCSLSLICFSPSLLSPHDFISTCFIVLHLLGYKLHEDRDFSLFSSLPRILFGP